MKVIVTLVDVELPCIYHDVSSVIADNEFVLLFRGLDEIERISMVDILNYCVVC